MNKGTSEEIIVRSRLVVRDFKLKGEAARLTRLDLARWLTSRENPLTARVFMNRMWRQFFGTGISAAIDDIGAQGEWPSHAALLDWLAVEFVESGWDVKRFVKLLVAMEAPRYVKLPIVMAWWWSGVAPTTRLRPHHRRSRNA